MDCFDFCKKDCCNKCNNYFCIQGPTGATGRQGATGATGPTGPNGPTGTADTITIRNTATGDAGTPAQVTDVTGSPNHTLDFVIPKGDKGDKGEQGIQGEQGEQGEMGPPGECKCCGCYDQLKNVIKQLIALYPTTTVVINTAGGGNISGRLSSLYPTFDNAGLISLKNGSNMLVGAVNLCKIASLKISGAIYNNSISYLEEPNDLQDNCSTNCEKAIRTALPVKTKKVEIKTWNQSIGSGEVLKNEYGMLVLVNEGDFNPTFVVTCKVESINEIVETE